MKVTRRKRKNTAVVVLLVIVILLAALVGGMLWFITTHFFMDGKPYPKNARELDLRDRKISAAEYEALQAELPDCEIHWSIPFQGSTFPEDTAILSVQSLSDGDLAMLAYFENLNTVDASNCRDCDQIRKLQAQYPDLEVIYTVTIGGKEYPQDAVAVATADLTDEEIALMGMLPQLKQVDANGCQDPARLAALNTAIPGLEVSYQVTLLGQTFTEKDTQATFRNPDVAELQTGLASLPHMEKVHLVEPEGDAATLRNLLKTYPDVTITWDKTIMGTTFSSAETEYDLSNIGLVTLVPPVWNDQKDAAQTQEILSKVEAIMTWFPNAEKVILPACAFDNETVAAFREKMRPEYKVVWTVYITKKAVRTDQEIIHSSAYSVCFIDELSQDLKYCEDAIVVDIGHSYVKDVSWVKGMPKLKYLILTHNWVKDISPLSTCKNLVYLELYWNDYIPDYSPLVECTSLKDLNISGTFADPTPLAQMTWLNNLWAAQCRFTKEEEQMLKDALPNTTMMFGGGDYAAGGWRQVPGYFEMRDIMGLPYNKW